MRDEDTHAGHGVHVQHMPEVDAMMHGPDRFLMVRTVSWIGNRLIQAWDHGWQ